jgi:hypothetical protein
MAKELQYGSNIIKRYGNTIFCDFLPKDALAISQKFIQSGDKDCIGT